MSTPTIDINEIVPAAARKAVYAVYGAGALIAGAASAGFLALAQSFPDWLVATNGIIAFLAIPFSALAFAKTPNKNEVVVEVTELPPLV